MYCRLTPAVQDPCFCWPVSSSAPTAMRFLRQRRTAPSSPATACFLTWLIAAVSFHDARFSSRCAQSGDRSPQCSAIDQPFRDGSPLASAFTYFPARSHVCVRGKHDLSAPIRAERSRSAARAPILAAAAALCSFVFTNNMITGGCAHVTGISSNQPIRPGQAPTGGCRTRCCPLCVREYVLMAYAQPTKPRAVADGSRQPSRPADDCFRSSDGITRLSMRLLEPAGSGPRIAHGSSRRSAEPLVLTSKAGDAQTRHRL